MTQNQTRSKVLYDTPKIIEKCSEEPSPSPLPILQANWGSINGFESIIKKDSVKHWDTDIREMVGAGILTSDADGSKTRRKKTPRKKIKPVNDQNKSIVLLEEQNKSCYDSATTNELYTDVSNISESAIGGLNEQNSIRPPLDGQQSLNKQTGFPISLETFNNITETHDKQSPIKLDALNTFKNQIKSPVSSEIPELNTEEQSVKSDSLNNDINEKLLKKQCEFINSLETSNKITEFNNKQHLITFDFSNSQSLTKINLEQSHANINEQKNNQNQLIESSNLKTVAKKTNRENDPNILKSFNNYNYSLTENKSNAPSKNLKEQGLSNKNDTNNSKELKSPTKSISIEPLKPNLVDEIPYKCDDTAINVSKTSISKTKHEYNLSKPYKGEHYDDSLTGTPSIKVFREAYLNNSIPLSLTPASVSSKSADTMIVSLEQNYIETSKNNNCTIIDKKDLVECTPLKSKEKLLNKSKITDALKKKSIRAKKKQLYESVKVEVFGSEISSSSSSHELFNTNEQPKSIVINKKPQDEEKKSGFKHISKSKLIKSMSIVNGNSIENHLSNELNMQPSIKPIIVQPKSNNENDSEKIKNKSSNKFKKSMVHFDDPVEKFFNLSKSPTLYKSNNNNIGKIQKDTSFNDNSEQLIGLSRYLNKRTSTIYDYSPTGKTIKTIKPRVKTTKINNSDSNINSKMYDVDRSSKNLSSSDFSNKRKVKDMKNQGIKLSKNCITDVNKLPYGMQNNAALDESIAPLESVKTMTIDDNVFKTKCNSNDKIDINLDISELPIVNYNSSVNNTSCVTVNHDDTLDVRINKICDPLDNIEYLKKSKVYEVITEDGDHEVC